MEFDMEADWDEARYLELNSYFRVRIQILLDSDPNIKDLVQQGKSLDISDLIDCFSDDDLEMWREFIHLDRIKLHRDLRNHLEGRGTPYNPRDGFAGPHNEDEDRPPVW